MSGLSVADILERAADLIEPDGRWSKGWQAHNAAGSVVGWCDDDAVNWCLVSAIWKSADGSPYDEADRIIRTLVPDGLAGQWNDAPERTQAEVVAKLREAAVLARSKGR